MNQRFISVLVFAFIVAAGASILLYRLMQGKVAAAPTPAVKVIMAARTLDPGTLIKEADLKIVDWTGPLPAGVILKPEDAVGRGVVSAVMSGEPLLDTRLAPKGGGAGLAAMIPQGWRAVAVRVNEVVGVGGFAVPGMKVDVLVSGNPPANGGTSGSQSRTLLQNVVVLSANQEFKKDTEGKPMLSQVVNLLVTPGQAEMLSLASTETKIQLILRNPMDTEIAKTNGAGMNELFNGERTSPMPNRRQNQSELPRQPQKKAAPAPLAPAPAPVRAAVPAPAPAPPVPPKPEPVVVEMIHGNKKVETRFVEQGATATSAEAK